MSDRPAAELLADHTEWQNGDCPNPLPDGPRRVLVRLARAEQALANRELIARAVFDTKYPRYELFERDELWADFGAIGRQDTYYEVADSVVAALRASQGGQT